MVSRLKKFLDFAALFFILSIVVASFDDSKMVFPNYIQLNIHGSDREVKLIMKKDSIDVPTFQLENRVITPFEGNKNSSLYRGIHRNSFVFASLLPKQFGNNFTFDGMFVGAGRLFSIKSHINSAQRTSRYLSHILYERQLTHNDSEHISYDVTVTYKIINPVRWKRSVAKSYNIELIFVTAFDFYERWLHKSTKSTLKERVQDAFNNIKRYLHFISEGINLRFSNMEVNDFSITVYPVSAIITTTRKDSFWTENIMKNKMVEGSQVLTTFMKWIKSGHLISQADHFQLITGYDVLGYGDPSTNGLSNGWSLCKPSGSVSLVEDRAEVTKTTAVSTHEIAHSLGVHHDGFGNSCSSRHNYIMSTSVGSGDADKLKNVWYFSSCSVESLRQALRVLDSEGYKCLNDQPRSNFIKQGEELSQHLPGQVYSPNEQCRLMFGSQSRHCVSINKDPSKICTSMYCSRTTDTNKCWPHLAARGTSCGNHKWCKNGECVPDLNAPAMNDKCPYGDTEENVLGSYGCSRIVSVWSFLCKSNTYGVADKCCKSCEKWILI